MEYDVVETLWSLRSAILGIAFIVLVGVASLVISQEQ